MGRAVTRMLDRMRRSAALLPAAVVLACLAAPCTPAAAAAGKSGADVERQLTALSAEVDRLEGARAVKKLQRAFGYYLDRGLWSEAADLFADDGTIEIGMDGVYVGKPRIVEYLQRLGGGHPGLIYGQLNEWLQLQPVVDVAADARSARGRWRDLGMLGEFQHDASWRDGIYENDYVNDRGVWKIASLHLYVNFVAPYAGGWARLAAAPADWRSEAAKAFPPDRPPTIRYRPFPEPQLVPLHATGPASAKTPRAMQ